MSHFEIKEGLAGNQKGEWRWTLYADNGDKIANSGEGYTSKAHCTRMAYRVRDEYKDAKVLDVDGKIITKATALGITK